MLLVIAVALSLFAASSIATASGIEKFSFEPTSHVVEKGRDPQVAVRASGDLFLLRVDGQNLWLQTSSDGGDSFDEGVRVNDAGDVTSHAESTPQMIVRSMHEFYCLWESRDKQGHASLRLARSMDWGKSFSNSIPVDPSSTATQSFYSMAEGPDGTLFVVWLDGRDREKDKPETFSVYVARSLDHGKSFEKSRRVALDACPCCRPAVAAGSGKDVYISWRGVFDHDVRDMLVASSRDEGISFSAGTRVAQDDWQINGCPHAGDTMTVLNGRLFVSWHTVRGDQSRLFFAWSDDHGAHFSHPADVAGEVLDANHPRFIGLGGSAGLIFQGRSPSGKGDWGKLNVYFRQITAVGSLLPLQNLGHASGSATYPSAAYESPNHLFVTWTERKDDGPSIVLDRGRNTPQHSGEERSHAQ